MRLAKLLNNSGFFMFNNIQYPPRQVLLLLITTRAPGKEWKRRQALCVCPPAALKMRPWGSLILSLREAG